MTPDLLLVLIVRDAALRGVLIGQLSLDGELLVTFDGSMDDAAFDRSARPPAVLITDDDGVAARFDELAAGDRWCSFLHLCDDVGAAPHSCPRAVRIARSDAPAQIRVALAGWRTREG